MSELLELREWIQATTGHISYGDDIQVLALEYLRTARAAVQLHDEACLRAQRRAKQAEDRRDYFKRCLEQLAEHHGVRVIYEDKQASGDAEWRMTFSDSADSEFRVRYEKTSA